MGPKLKVPSSNSEAAAQMHTAMINCEVPARGADCASTRPGGVLRVSSNTSKIFGHRPLTPSNNVGILKLAADERWKVWLP